MLKPQTLEWKRRGLLGARPKQIPETPEQKAARIAKLTGWRRYFYFRSKDKD